MKAIRGGRRTVVRRTGSQVDIGSITEKQGFSGLRYASQTSGRYLSNIYGTAIAAGRTSIGVIYGQTVDYLYGLFSGSENQ